MADCACARSLTAGADHGAPDPPGGAPGAPGAPGTPPWWWRVPWSLLGAGALALLWWPAVRALRAARTAR
ncbi:hypothetical protein [Murinocardiopsis flavida]|uniref:hypothetical protein n=1 Tax=Murinocardiopsis flavida TaxID=645275 RepID=UPI0011B22506|nr:hypothetical protein [Murinocardiopsis flavida]